MHFLENLSNFCATGDFMPHGYCYLWKPGLVLLHVISDSLIYLAYLLIPCTLLYFIRKREDLPFNWIFACFGLFIIACGTTHLMEVLTIWVPLYWLAGFIKAFTAIVSVFTAILLIRLIPKALALPSPEMLRLANQALQKEIAERKLAEQALRANELRMVEILATASDAFIAVNADDLITEWNHQAEVIFGWSYQEAVNQPLTQLIIPSRYQEQHRWRLSDFLKNGNTASLNKRMELMALRRDGTEFPIEMSLWFTKIDGVYHANVMIHDISERRDLDKLTRQHQLKIERAARVNSVGELTVAIAHELNQPLAAIGSYIRGCLLRLHSVNFSLADIIDAMQLAAEQSDRAGEIIHRMKDFIRKGQLYYEMINVNELINNTITLLNTEIGDSGVNIAYELEPHLPAVQADKLQLEQVIINLVRNSLEAMRDAQTHLPKIIIRTVLLHKQALRIDITDNGPGFSSNFRESMEPYFTTKDYGMGLGLSICRTIVEAHGGQLAIKSPAQGGAWVQFTLSLQGSNDTE